MGRLLLVSNRLPVTVSFEDGELEVERSSGGLATGLGPHHEAGDSLWIGWPGKTWAIPEERRADLDARLAEMRLSPVHLAEEDVRRYYEGFCNGVLWPLFHYMLEHIPLHSGWFDVYERVNARFADEVARVHRPGDVVWVHDFQLLLLPGMLRERLPDARIGFFLHIPFPASAVLRTLPHRERILSGMLGADVIGFHTHSYVRHFAAALLRVLGLEITVDSVRHQGREVRLGAFPMGIDARAFAERAREPSVRARAAEIRGADGCRVLMGIDRLDYTKGIPRRLLAFEHLLRTHEDLRGRVRLVQVAVPSRSNVQAYKKQRELVDELVGRINGAFGTPTWVPVHYMHSSMNRDEIVALYLAADVMLVTPIRDGMNLVAKEFVASRNDLDGVLVLSEFAGAAAELAAALQINPFDLAATSTMMRRALDMPSAERTARMRSMRTRVFEADGARWVASFLGTVESQCEANATQPAGVSSSRDIDAAIERAAGAEHLCLVLDYDGTLVPFAPLPGMAAPDAELLELLVGLSKDARLELHLLSGRPRADLEGWFGSLPFTLHAEHGLWTRRAEESEWSRLQIGGLQHAGRIRSILEEFTARTPGSFVETKSSVIAWHWRQADAEYGARQANELRLHLAEVLSNVGAEVICGDKVIEVRPYGLHKGAIVPSLFAAAPKGTLVVAFGDDRTDEDLFAALPEESLAVHVGPKPSSARLRLPDPAAARSFLGRLRARRTS